MAVDHVRATLDVLRAHLPVTMHSLPSDLHEFQIDHPTWGEVLLRGRSVREVLITCDIGHPTPCAGNLSGIAVAVALAQRLRRMGTRYSYRLVFLPSSIGAITWLALNQSRVSRVRHSLALDGLGDAGRSSHEKSHRGNAEIDRAVAFALKEACEDISIEALSAADQPAVEPKSLALSLETLLMVIDVLEDNRIYVNLNPHDQPELNEAGLARLAADTTDSEGRRALLWVLNSSDGSKSLLDIASEGNLRWEAAKDAARGLLARGLITPIEKSRRPLLVERLGVNRTVH